jgi:HlyD family secretion protein
MGGRAKTAALVLMIAVGAGIGLRAYYNRLDRDEPTVTTARVTRGAIADTVAATGTLQAVETVEVGTQVSGTISWLGADFNSVVRKGQVIAKLEPSLFQTQLDQARANASRSTADLENARVKAGDARQQYDRARELSARQLIAQSDLDAAQVALDLADATVRSAEAQLAQAKAAVDQAELNLAHTVIGAPIDGIVIGRSVDVGQTVAASLSSPTLFSIAADLRHMQVSASVDESDIGRVGEGQDVTFRVDAYPDEVFAGTVVQVRLQPVVVQNVTTYDVMIDAPNQLLKLKPGMTASVSITIAARDDAVRIPNAALRFRPTSAVLAALRSNPEGAVPSPPTSGSLDSTNGRVWVYDQHQLRPIPVRLGISDGQATEMLDGELQPDMALVTTIATADDASMRATPVAASPLFNPGGGAFRGAGGNGGPPANRTR